MIEKNTHIKVSKSNLRKFGIIVGTGLLIICGGIYWEGKELNQLFIAIGILFFVAGISIPILLKPICWACLVFLRIIGWFITRVILILLFYSSINRMN